MWDMRMLRDHRVSALLGILVLGLLMAACGDSASSDRADEPRVPPVAGATEVADMQLDDAWYDAFGFKTSDARGTVYRTDTAFDIVTAYYSEAIADEGWTVVVSNPLVATSQTVMLTKGERVAMLTLMDGKTYSIAPGLGGLEDMNVAIANVTDNETIVTVQEYTCDEDEVASCTFLQP
jgi:hypothetical protein